MEWKIILAIFILSLSLLITPTYALRIYLRPMHQGIVNTDVYSLNGINILPAKVERSFELKNENNVSITVEIETTGEINGLVEVEKSVLLYPGESKNITYTVSVSEPKIYRGNFLLTYIPSNNQQPVSAESNLVVVANKVEIPILYALLPSAIVVFAVGLLVYKKIRGKKK